MIRPTLTAENRALRRRLRAAERFCHSVYMIECEDGMVLFMPRDSTEREKAYREWKKLHDAQRKRGRK